MQQMITTICLVSRRKRITKGLSEFKSVLTIFYLFYLTPKIDFVFVLQGFEFSLCISFVSNSWFAPDVTAAMLVYRTIAKKVFSEFDSIIMQNLSDILLLFCTPTWPSHHVSATQE